MAKWHTNSARSEAVAMAGLLALPAALAFYCIVAAPAIGASFSLEASDAPALSEIPCALLRAALQVLPACVFAGKEFLPDLQKMLLSLWLVLLVLAATVSLQKKRAPRSEL